MIKLGCNCGKRRRPAKPPRRPAKPHKISEEYTLTTRQGGTLTFGSKLEADAANARAGYTGVVRPATTT